MAIKEVIRVPTGYILIVEGQKGKLECLSIGDYGKEHNIKADFLGLPDPINGVTAKQVMPLTKKWVVTISSQYGCSMRCKFCDVPLVGPGINASVTDMDLQVASALSMFPDITKTARLNIHYARMGEPTFNPAVLEHARNLIRSPQHDVVRNSLVHPVLSTMMPKAHTSLLDYLLEWCEIKNEVFGGNAGLQLSINTTNEQQRQDMFDGCSLSLAEISEIAGKLPDPVGRKYTVNIALADGTEVDGKEMARLFDPARFICKITPIHVTTTSTKFGVTTAEGYHSYVPYQQCEEDLKANGFDVLVFVPSMDEDEGMITCGNAVLSGRQPKTVDAPLVPLPEK